MKNRFLALFVILISWNTVSGQMKDYRFIRPLTGATDTWNRIIIPEDIFGKIQADFSDLRIFGINPQSDTIEAPYLLNVAAGKSESHEIPFDMINRVRNKDGFFNTLKLNSVGTINEIKLDFGQSNFDWKVSLEGSEDMKEWFTIVEGYRILSIRNDHTDYHFTTIDFPDTRFTYFRLSIPTAKDPDLRGVSVMENETREGSYITGRVREMKVDNKKEGNPTTIMIRLEKLIPVSYVHVTIRDGYDYYRPVTISSVTDSVETEKGWQYNYRLLASGTLSSFEKPEFRFAGAFTSILNIAIENYDNAPLQVDSVIVKGYVHELLVRITEPAEYFLAYGNPDARRPYYDIENFRDKIPDDVQLVALGEERRVGEIVLKKSASIFENKILLWSVMIVIILVLGWFSIRMISRKE